MANEPSEAALLNVSVCYALPGHVWLRELRLPDGATVADALAASGFAQAFPVVQPWERGVGVFGRAAEPQSRLAEGDRVEIYRGLSFDPKESRRRRAEHRRTKTAKNGRVRPAGLL
ncbi:RnfH family protein [Achromobacter sp. LC458]|uniref:RnfH family protein n=1 Tax=unclassified Achromobacter TaxID=2626865 RepID=UPI00062A101F|nr:MULTISPECIES: RnfH family protein [unclassified Achromobacter]AYD64366.1 RnfH family protein [Achromobacter sp. B7]TRM50035.1 RnfH family protein [Achromobacter sp. LC458]